jgi:tRNA threonylcarbamoyladenosine biosynthesis protein TsaE
MNVSSLRINLPNIEATAETAARFGKILSPGDTLLLHGEIGSGKTFFARALIQSLQDVAEDVPSPTFTLVQSYETSKGEVVHADLYRLTTPDEATELGFADAIHSAIVLIEWPDRLGSDTPAEALHLQFEAGAGETERVLTINIPNPAWRDKLAVLQNE